MCIAILLLVFALLLSSWCSASSGTDVSNKLLRFHVIANSDSPDDQALKLRVRDQVLNNIGPMLESSTSREMSEDIIRTNLDKIREIARNEITKSGKCYEATAQLCISSFPTKQYSDIVLPAGEYEALKVVLGKGEGKNWWCVMFPPLCFIDITHGITSKDMEYKLKSILTDEEYESILASSDDINTSAVKKPIVPTDSQSAAAAKEPEKVEIKFMSVEVFKALFQQIEKLFASR